MRRVLIVNAYVGNNQPAAFARWVAKQRPSIVLGSEFLAVYDAVKKAGFNLVRGNGSRGNREVGIASTRHVRHSRIKQLTVAVPDVGVAHDRWYVYARFWRNAFIALHGNAAIQADDGGFKDWRPAQLWRQAMFDLRDVIRADQAKGRRVSVGGDFNWRKRPGSDVEGSPQWLARECGLKYVTNELMWLLYDPYWEVENFQVLDDVPTNDKHPHPALLVDLVPR